VAAEQLDERVERMAGVADCVDRHAAIMMQAAAGRTLFAAPGAGGPRGCVRRGCGILDGRAAA
jgi:hypothetical protein